MMLLFREVYCGRAGVHILQERKWVPSEIQGGGEAGAMFCFPVFLFPLCSMLQEAQGENTHGLPPGCCQYCAEKNS